MLSSIQWRSFTRLFSGSLEQTFASWLQMLTNKKKDDLKQKCVSSQQKKKTMINVNSLWISLSLLNQVALKGSGWELKTNLCTSIRYPSLRKFMSNKTNTDTHKGVSGASLMPSSLASIRILHAFTYLFMTIPQSCLFSFYRDVGCQNSLADLPRCQAKTTLVRGSISFSLIYVEETFQSKRKRSK